MKGTDEEREIRGLVVFVSGISLRVLKKRSKRFANLIRKLQLLHDSRSSNTQEVTSGCERTMLQGFCRGRGQRLVLCASSRRRSCAPAGRPHSRESPRREEVTSDDAAGRGAGRGRPQGDRHALQRREGKGEAAMDEAAAPRGSQWLKEGGAAGSARKAAKKKRALTIFAFVVRVQVVLRNKPKKFW